MSRFFGPLATAAILLCSVGTAYGLTVYVNGVYAGELCGSLGSSSSLVGSSSLCRALEREYSLRAASSSIANLPPVPPPSVPPPAPNPELVAILEGIDDMVDSGDEAEFTDDVIRVSTRMRVFGRGAIGPVNRRLLDYDIPPMEEVDFCFTDGVPDTSPEVEICIQTALMFSVKGFTAVCGPANPFCPLLRTAVRAREHEFRTMNNVVCDTRQVSPDICNVDFVYRLVLSQNEYAAPLVRSPRFQPVVEGAQVVLQPINPVRIYFRPDGSENVPPFCHLNKTDPGHVLHRGQVLRCIRMEGTRVISEAVGTGTGCFALLNEIGGKLVFERLNSRLRNALDELNVFVHLPPPPPPPTSSL